MGDFGDIGYQLNQLETHGLIRLAQQQPELEYLFRHSLIQDAVYASLLKQDRKRLHQAVGAVLMRTYPDHLSDLAPRLSDHYYEAGDDNQALRFLELAADAEARRYANAEAGRHYARAIEIARRMASNATLTQLHARYGRVLELSGRFDEALANYEELGHIGQARQDASMELAALVQRAVIYATPTVKHDLARGRELSELALMQARRLGDRPTEAKALWTLMLVNTFSANYAEALICGEQSLAISRELNLTEQLAYTLNDMYVDYASQGMLDQAQQVLDESQALWRELNNLPMLVDNLSSSAGTAYLAGQPDRALVLAGEAQRISQVIGNLWGQSYSLMMQGDVYFEQAEFSKAIRVMRECIRLGEQAGFAVAEVAERALLAFLYCRLGMLDHAFQMVQSELIRVEHKHPLGHYWTHSVLALLYCLRGSLDEAEAALKEAALRTTPDNTMDVMDNLLSSWADMEIALARHDYPRLLTVQNRLIENMHTSGVHIYLADALRFKGRMLIAQGRYVEARITLQEACVAAESRGSTFVLGSILAQLSDVEHQLGDIPESQRLRAQAHGIMTDIVARQDDAEVRESFLKTAEVRRVLELAR